MRLGGAGGSADPVAAGPSAQQNDHVAGSGRSPEHVASGSSAHNRPDFHPFRDIVRMVDLFHIACRKTDLIAIGTVAVRRFAHQLFLRKLALHRILYGRCRIRRASHAHRLVDVSSPGERIADRPSEACGGAAEGFDLRRMIMSLVLEIDQPLFCFSVDFNRHHDGAGVNLIRLLLIVQFAFSLQFSGSHGGQVHQADIFVPTSLIDLPEVSKVPQESLFDRPAVIAFVKIHLFQFRRKGSVAAVVRPVGIQNPDLRHGRIPVRLLPVVILNKLKITEGHREIQRSVKRLKRFLLHVREAFKGLYIFRFIKYLAEGIRLFHPAEPGIHRIIAIVPDLAEFFVCKGSLTDVDGRGPDQNFLIFFQEADALHRGIRALVKLSRQILHREDPVFRAGGKHFVIQGIYRRFGEYALFCLFEYLIRDVLHIISDQDPDLFQGRDPQIAADFMPQIPGGSRKGFLLLHIYSSDIAHILFFLSACPVFLPRTFLFPA